MYFPPAKLVNVFKFTRVFVQAHWSDDNVRYPSAVIDDWSENDNEVCYMNSPPSYYSLFSFICVIQFKAAKRSSNTSNIS